jgi:hypothetical protein
MKKTAALAGLILLVASAADAYIEALYPLQQFIVESEVIAEGVIDKVDAKTKTCMVKVKKSIKGKCAYELIRINVGGAQEWHADAVMPHLVAGAPAVIFYNAERRAEVYVNRFFVQLYGDPEAAPDKAWWNLTHIEIHCNRTFNGTATELIKVLNDVLSGKSKGLSPDPKLPEITPEAVKALPVWGKAADASKLPPPFLRREKKTLTPRSPENPAGLEKGIAYEYFEFDDDQERVPDFETLKKVDSGFAERIDLSKKKRDVKFAFRFSGFIDVPKEGTYTFFSTSDDGSKVLIGKEEAVWADGSHGAIELSGDIALKAGKHAITILYYQNGDEAVLEVSWEGPGLKKQKIGPETLFHARGK